MRRVRIHHVVVAVAFLTAGCSGTQTVSPIAPTSLVNGAAATAGTTQTNASMFDRTAGVVRELAVVESWAAQNGWAQATGLQVEGTASITAVTGTCPSVVVTVQGVPVTVDSTTTYGTGLTCSGLTVGKTVHVTGLLTFAAGSFSVAATNISLPADGGGTTPPSGNPTPPGPGNTTPPGPGRGGERKRAGEGNVASLRGTCPTLTMVIHGVRVETTAATEFVNAACGNIRVGTKVKVEGDLGDDGVLTATKVEITDQPGGHNRFGGEGTVGSLRGTCPTLTMVIRGYAVMTSESTTFTGGVCADIRPGTRVFVTGVNQANSLMAEEVEIRGHGEP